MTDKKTRQMMKTQRPLLSQADVDRLYISWHNGKKSNNKY